MPFLQNAQDVHISYSDFRDISGDYSETIVTNRRGRGRSDDAEVGGNYYDISRYTSNLPISDELMNVIRASQNGNGRPPPTPQATSNGRNNMDSRHTSRSSRNNFNRTDRGYDGQAGTSNVNPAGSINFTRRVSSSRSGEQSSSVDPAGAQIDFMNGGSSGGVLSINNATLAVAGRSVRIATSRHTQAPISQFSPEVAGGVTRGLMASQSPVTRAPVPASQATLDEETSPLHDTSRSSTNVPRPEVSINEALKEPPSKKEDGFLGF